jgi:hypothetical protein
MSRDPFTELVWGFSFGASLWHSFIAGPISFRTLEKPLFSKLQSKLFPVYFYAIAFCVSGQVCEAVRLLPVPVDLFDTFSSAKKGYVVFTVVSLALSLAQILVIGPAVTSAIDKREKLVKDGASQDQLKAANKKFAAFHGISSLANMIVFLTAAARPFFV